MRTYAVSVLIRDKAVVKCTEDDPVLQKKCSGYERSTSDKWCRFCFDAAGQISDECFRPGILMNETEGRIMTDEHDKAIEVIEVDRPDARRMHPVMREQPPCPICGSSPYEPWPECTVCHGTGITIPVLYGTIVADPPWNEQGGGRIKRGADRHYPLMKTPQIIEAILQADIWNPANDCRLYLWTTNNFLPDGLHVMQALGFRYITNIAWIKDRIGLGQYHRGQHELCLLGVRGRTVGKVKPPTVIHAKRTEHSRKPEEFYIMIESCSPGPRLEMFARSSRPGWTTWGDEIG